MGTNTEILSTKVSPEIRRQFEDIADSYGASPAAALRMLTYSFVKAGGFPYPMNNQNQTTRKTSVIPLDSKTFFSALENLQEAMAGKAEAAGLASDEDVMALVREVRYGEKA